jgi:putative Mg2+ transporter-C (MgtC) family protein
MRLLLSSSIPTLDTGAIVFRLVVAAALGGAVGIERELRDREAGLRTHLLVSSGSALFTLVSAYGFHEFLTTGGNIIQTDPTRIAAQIVTGIGFLGAGAIIREGLSIRGLTTAATLWVVAAIGMACGAGYYAAAITATVLTIVALWPLRIGAHTVIERFRPEEKRVVVEVKEGQSALPLLNVIEARGAQIQHFELAEERDRRVITLEVEPINEELVAALTDLEYVIGARWHR